MGSREDGERAGGARDGEVRGAAAVLGVERVRAGRGEKGGSRRGRGGRLCSPRARLGQGRSGSDRSRRRWRRPRRRSGIGALGARERRRSDAGKGMDHDEARQGIGWVRGGRERRRQRFAGTLGHRKRTREKREGERRKGEERRGGGGLHRGERRLCTGRRWRGLRGGHGGAGREGWAAVRRCPEEGEDVGSTCQRDEARCGLRGAGPGQRERGVRPDAGRRGESGPGQLGRGAEADQKGMGWRRKGKKEERRVRDMVWTERDGPRK